MNVTIRKIGNSEGVILPKEVLDRLGAHAGDVLSVFEDNGELRLKLQTDDPEQFERKMAIARERMKKYESAYRVLAK